MKRVIGAALLGLAATLGTELQAASLCNCCSSGTDEACKTACEATTSLPQCSAVVDFDGDARIGPDHNPLYGASLKDLRITGATRVQLESFRALLEASRKGAEADRKQALRDRKRGEIDSITAGQKALRYEQAIVNYYLGVAAYRSALNSGQQTAAASR
jgi:hypothetical protein